MGIGREQDLLVGLSRFQSHIFCLLEPNFMFSLFLCFYSLESFSAIEPFALISQVNLTFLDS